MNAFLVILIIVIIAVAAYFVWQQVKKSRDPEYAAQMSKRRAARDIERQQRKLERAQQRELRARYEESIAPAKAELLKAKQDYHGRIKRREDEINKLQREHDRTVREREKAITEIEKRYSQHLITVNGIKLFADRIATRDATATINNTFFAEVHSGTELAGFGGKYQVFSIVAAAEGAQAPLPGGSSIGGIGTPESPWEIAVSPEGDYLFIMGTVAEAGNQPFNLCLALDARNREDAEKLMSMLNQTAEKTEQIERRRERELADAKAALDSATNDTAALDEAQAALERERDDHASVDNAQAALEQAEKQAQEETGYVPHTRK